MVSTPGEVGVSPRIVLEFKRKVVPVAAIGTVIEWYDLFIAGTSASLVFPRILFPQVLDPGIALIYSLLATLLVSYLGRPLGAFIFGHLGDRLGRKSALTWNLVLMGIGTLGIGLIPDYATAGYLGIWLLVLFRFLQAIGVGGEWGGGTTLILEYAYTVNSRWRAFWASWVDQGLNFGLLLSSAVLAILSILYPGQLFLIWGWRIAFFIGAIAVIIGAFIRYAILESLPFIEAKQKVGTSKAPSIVVWRYFWKTILLLAIIHAAASGIGNTYIFYSVAYLVGLGISRDIALFTQIIATAISIITTVFFASLSDRFGRKKVMIFMLLLCIPIGIIYPIMLITKNIIYIIFAQILIWSIVTIGFQAPRGAFTGELFPTRYRYSGSALAFAIGTLLGGSLAPVVEAAIVGTQYIEKWWGISITILIYAIAAILALIVLSETRERKLEH